MMGDNMPAKLIEFVRANIIESSHYGSIAVVDSTGKLLYSAGDADRVTYFHSSAKPIQGIASLEAGIAEEFGLDLKEIAVIISSHSGEVSHIDVLHNIMEKTGFNEEAVQCGIANPIDAGVLKELYNKGMQLTNLHCNCSGKHLGMLASASLKGYSLADYYKAEHPIQQKIKHVISEFAGYKPELVATGVDGCGVPVFALPLKNMAQSYANLCNTAFQGGRYKKSQNYVLSAMTMFPEYVAGTGRFDTLLMKKFGSRVLCKTGAEGVCCASVLDRMIGIAVKIEDGALRAAPSSMLEALVQLGVLEEGEAGELGEFRNPPIIGNKGSLNGEAKPVFKLTNLQ